MISSDPSSVTLNGGVYPNEDGTWRVCCWISGMKSQHEAQQVSQWLQQLISSHIVDIADDIKQQTKQ
jgi:hypothetical protein